MDIVTIEQIVAIVKDVGIAALVIFVFYRYIVAASQSQKASDDIQNRLIGLVDSSRTMFERLDATLQKNTESQDRVVTVQQDAVQRHTANGEKMDKQTDAVLDMTRGVTALSKDIQSYHRMLGDSFEEMRTEITDLINELKRDQNDMLTIVQQIPDNYQQLGDVIAKHNQRVIDKLDELLEKCVPTEKPVEKVPANEQPVTT